MAAFWENEDLLLQIIVVDYTLYIKSYELLHGYIVAFKEKNVKEPVTIVLSNKKRIHDIDNVPVNFFDRLISLNFCPIIFFCKL